MIGPRRHLLLVAGLLATHAAAYVLSGPHVRIRPARCGGPGGHDCDHRGRAGALLGRTPHMLRSATMKSSFAPRGSSISGSYVSPARLMEPSRVPLKAISVVEDWANATAALLADAARPDAARGLEHNETSEPKARRRMRYTQATLSDMVLYIDGGVPMHMFAIARTGDRLSSSTIKAMAAVTTRTVQDTTGTLVPLAKEQRLGGGITVGRSTFVEVVDVVLIAAVPSMDRQRFLGAELIRKIAIWAATTGSGHLVVTHAINEELEEYLGQLGFQHIGGGEGDAMVYSGRGLDGLIKSENFRMFELEV